MSEDGREPSPFEWADGIVLTRAVLSEYAGRYYSEALEAPIAITTDGTTLRLDTRRLSGRPLRSVRTDTFTTELDRLVDTTTIRFVRDGSGAVTGLTLSCGRTENVEFARAPSAQ